MFRRLLIKIIKSQGKYAILVVQIFTQGRTKSECLGRIYTASRKDTYNMTLEAPHDL